MKSIAKHILDMVAAASIFLIWIFTMLQVLSRYVFARPFGYSLELISLAFLLSIYVFLVVISCKLL